MQRTLLSASLLLLLILAGLGIWLLGADPAAPAAGAGGGSSTSQATVETAGPAVTTDAPTAPVERAMVASADAALDDPEIRAGLCGFKGRVVDARKAPVGDCGVRILRGAMDTVLPSVDSLFAPSPDRDVEIVAGETRTAGDGRWQITGVWPNAFYLLHGGIGTEAPTHQVVNKMPSPGEIVDLGDLVLQDAGVITGVVLGDDGEGLAGALVRAVDVPGAIAALYPIERIEPDAVLLVREESSPVRVFEMPRWIKKALESLPIPSTRSGPDGAFRLVGVVPGSNLLATIAPAHLGDVKPSVLVKPGQTKDVGKIRLRAGEELLGKVVDTQGKAIVGAEVLAGSTVAAGPVDFAQRLRPTDAEGRFQGNGFGNGKVTIAARRGRTHEWTLAKPQSIAGEVVITLPATFGVDVTVALADGQPAKTARFQLLSGRADNGTANLHLLGMAPPIELRDRLQAKGAGAWRIEPLPPGKYTLAADAPGHASAFAEFALIDADSKAAITLTTPQVFTVRTLAADDRPVRNAMIYAETSGDRRLVQMPVAVGRTDGDGVRRIDTLQGQSLRVSASHPKWGTVHGDVKVGEEVVLRFQPPGSLHGIVSENGKPPALGKFTISVVRRRGDGETRGPLESTPLLLTPGQDGAFTVAALQPGRYEITALNALDALRSPGGLVGMIQDAFLMRSMPETEATVVAGQPAAARLEVGEQPLEGPVATLGGTVTVDGKLAVGYGVTARLRDRDFAARTDERGHFSFGNVHAGSGEISLLSNGGGDGGLFAGPRNLIWKSKLELKEGEARELDVTVQTSSLRGVCVLPDGSAAANAFVQGRGKLKGTSEDVWVGASTTGTGEFHFPQVAEGTWSLSARIGGDDAARGELAKVEAVGGLPTTGLRLELKAMARVRGKVDLTSFAQRKPRWIWLEFRTPGTGEGRGRTQHAGVDLSDGSFRCDELDPGIWDVRLHANWNDQQQPQHASYASTSLTVPAAGLNDVLLRPGAPLER